MRAKEKRICLKSLKAEPSEPIRGLRATVQAGSYAAELFAAQHVWSDCCRYVLVYSGLWQAFTFATPDDLLYIWRYDRECVIRCFAFNFIDDLPRFLVLLLAMQRFENRHWGFNPRIDPGFDAE